MAGLSTELAPVIAASTRWLARAYPPADSGPAAHTRVEMQARDAVTVAALLRYPTELDAQLVAIAGPGGSAVLDWRAGNEPGYSSPGGSSAGGSSPGGGDDYDEDDEGWRTWVDEVVVSWAACLLADPMLAVRAVKAVTPNDLGDGRRLLAPDEADRTAAVLLRHPDLLEPIAGLHRDALLYLLPAPTSAQSD